MALKQPVGQKRLTNIAIVRYKAKGKRYEIACYKNKVLNWRDGIEKDLNEVIQTDQIFENVSKGIFANTKDLEKAFGTTNGEEICKLILKKGDLQVSDKEREAQLEGLIRDIVQIVVERCVHPQTGRQLTAITVDNALKSIGLSVQPEQPAKKQALKAIESLCAEMPESFSRAKMRLRITFPDSLAEEVKKHLVEATRALIEDESTVGSGNQRSITFCCEPNQYRELDRFANVTHAGAGLTIQVVTNAVHREEGDAIAIGVGASAGAATAQSGEVAELANPVRPGVTPAASTGPQKFDPPSRDIAVDSTSVGQCKVSSDQTKKKGFRCSSCDAEFEDAGEYRKHCRSDWHNFNLKRKVKSLPPVTEEEHAEIALDIREGFLGVDS